jgi:hypothetical protein
MSPFKRTLREHQLAMKTIDQIRSKCHSMSLRKDVPELRQNMNVHIMMDILKR